MIKDIQGQVVELGRAAESTILRILSKSLADKQLSQPAFDGLRNKLETESESRKIIAEKVRARFMPLCVCQKCDNLREGRLVEDIIELILDEEIK